MMKKKTITISYPEKISQNFEWTRKQKKILAIVINENYFFFSGDGVWTRSFHKPQICLLVRALSPFLSRSRVWCFVYSFCAQPSHCQSADELQLKNNWHLSTFYHLLINWLFLPCANTYWNWCKQIIYFSFTQICLSFLFGS